MNSNVVLLILNSALFLKFFDLLDLLYSGSGVLSWYDRTASPTKLSATIVTGLVTVLLFYNLTNLLREIALKKDGGKVGIVVVTLLTMAGMLVLMVLNNLPLAQ